MSLHLIGRARSLFTADMQKHTGDIQTALAGARVLVYGGAGSIGKELVKQIFAFEPAALHVIDISENNLTELVRDLRSSRGYISGETQFLPIDMGGPEAKTFLASQPRYDYALNLAAMKHVRSEKDPYSLMRMIGINVLEVFRSLNQAAAQHCGRYFAVSTDKAKNPANLMGATKRIAEDILFSADSAPSVTTARFANVAFSDGSLLHGFRQRLMLCQPISAPRDVQRYFLTGEESGMLCLLACTLGRHRDIFFPKLTKEENLLTFAEIAVRFLEANGYEAYETGSEEEARGRAAELIAAKRWPVFFFMSDTSGEKPVEEFYSETDSIEWDRLSDIGIIRSPPLTVQDRTRVNRFLEAIQSLRDGGVWSKTDLIKLLHEACPDLVHNDTGRFLDGKM